MAHAFQSDAALIERYLEHVRVEKRLAARTVTLYTADLQKLCAACEGAGVEARTAEHHHMRRFVAAMHSGGRSPRGIQLVLSGWRGFYAWLGREGLIAANPLDGVKTPKVPKPLPKALSVDEAVALAESGLRHTDDPADAWTQARDQLAVELLYGCGLRISELLGLDVRASSAGLGWVDAQALEVHVTGKGSKVRSVPLGQAAKTALGLWLAARSAGLSTGALDSGALFVGARGARLSAGAVRAMLRQRSLAAGLATPVRPHMLRHSFASHVLQSSGDLRAVQELLGHANISTTQVYTRLDFSHLAKVYDAAHPRAKKRNPPAA